MVEQGEERTRGVKNVSKVLACGQLETWSCYLLLSDRLIPCPNYDTFESKRECSTLVKTCKRGLSWKICFILE